MGLLTELGEEIIPEVFEALEGEGIVDTMDILSFTTTSDGGGGQRKASPTTAYSDVPVTYTPLLQTRTLSIKGDKQTSIQQYDFRFPAYHEGGRIDLNISHRLKILERDNEPEKVFRIVALGDRQGVFWNPVCEKEN